MLLFLRRHRVLVVTSFMLLVALYVVSAHWERPKDLTFLDNLGLYVVVPLQLGVRWALAQPIGLWHNYLYLVKVRQENVRLRGEIARLQGEVGRLLEADQANRRLRALLEFKERAVIPLIAAEVIGRDPSNWFKAVLIDRGTEDGVRRGMAVVNADGAVGTVMQASRRAAKVLLLIDTNSSLGVMVQRTRAKAILVGTLEDRAQLKYLRRSDDVAVGDLVVSSGLTGTYPKGIAVGRVSQVEKKGYGIFQYAEVTPSVDFSRLEEVFVVPDGRAEIAEAPAAR
ncbi:MAG: rod shape-determining protein MreC [Deltaproteobacteria bacterium]|nr:rod shape-determining protein MreC [Deltaproteobacteria bacterium]MBI3077891.1 rod shape-determining protein MreC [Deltaproteobacteria bacterium]